MSELVILRDLIDSVLSAAGGSGPAPDLTGAVPGGGAQVSPPDVRDVVETGVGLDHPKLPIRGVGVAGPALDAAKYAEAAATSWWELKKAIAYKKSRIPKPNEHKGEDHLTGGGDDE